MDNKKIYKAVTDIKRTDYSNLKQQQCTLNMWIRLAMQTYDKDMKARLEKELEEINEKIKYLGG